MPKPPSQKLYKLIKSLSKSEKRYFKLYAKDGDEKMSKYMQLFDWVDKSEFFDETEIIDKIYANVKDKRHKFSELKGYLFHLILRSIQSYDENGSVEYKITNMLLGIKSLFRRSLFDEANDLITKAIKIAIRYDKHSLMVSLLQWQNQIAYTQTDINFLDKKLADISNEIQYHLNQQRLNEKFRSQFLKLLVELRKNPTSDQIMKLTELIDFDTYEETSNSYLTTLYMLRLQTIIYFAKQENLNFYNFSHKLLRHIESQNHFLKEDVSEYISALNNHIVACGLLDKTDEVEQTLQKIRIIKPLTNDDELKKFRQYYMGLFRLHIHTGSFDKAYKDLLLHLKELKKYDAQIFAKNTFFLQYFSIAFGARRYDHALRFLNEWLSQSKTVERQDLQGLARILNLIIHFELKNNELLLSLLKSTKKYLHHREFFAGFERHLIKTILAVIQSPSQKEKRKIWTQLFNDYQMLNSSQNAPIILNWFPLKNWILSKVHNISMQDTYKLNAEIS